MPNHPFHPIDGELRVLTISSTALQNNCLGDPTTRQVVIYLPKDWQFRAALLYMRGDRLVFYYNKQ